MAITDSRVRKGRLSLTPLGGGAAVDLSCPITSIAWVPSPGEEEGEDVIETLCGDETTSPSGGAKSTWVLQLSLIQDFSDPLGLIAFSHEHDGEDVTAEVQLGELLPVKTATVRVWAIQEGGNVKERLTAEVSWPCQAAPTVVTVP